MSLIKYFFPPCLLLLVLPVWAQKFEWEKRIKAEEAPYSARRFVDALGFDKKVRWYREISKVGVSLEAKSRTQKHRYSIEFDTTGQLQDVEITFDWEELPVPLRDSICEELCRLFTEVRIVKFQRQIKGTPENVLNHLLTDGGSNTTVRYELIVAGKRKGEKNQYEITFSDKGRLEKTERILFRNTDNLEY